MSFIRALAGQDHDLQDHLRQNMADFFLAEGRLRPADAAAALIVVGADGHYLMQLRDQKAGIFYPGHWGLFGGAIDPGCNA